jgi:hypothetical protein
MTRKVWGRQTAEGFKNKRVIYKRWHENRTRAYSIFCFSGTSSFIKIKIGHIYPFTKSYYILIFSSLTMILWTNQVTNDNDIIIKEVIGNQNDNTKIKTYKTNPYLI